MLIRLAVPEDLPAVLRLQKLAFVSEAELLGDYSIAPLHQTLEGVEEDFRKGPILVATPPDGPDVVGSVRAREEDGLVEVAKLIVHPDRRDRGLGGELLLAVEKLFGPKRYRLFTTEKSLKNLHLYRKMGYREFMRSPMTPTLAAVHLEKVLDG